MAGRVREQAEALRRKQLGQYFTPAHVATALVSLVRRALPPLPPEPTVADLACGDGALLLAALRGEPLTVPERCYGLDIDRSLAPGWSADPLLSRCRLRLGDGLAPLEEHDLLPPGGVDLVLGNPPYNGSQNLITDPEVLGRFDLGRRPGAVAPAGVQTHLPGFGPSGASQLPLTIPGPATVTSQPIEALFVEQSLNAARAGGYIALILPEGLLANQGCRDVRDLVLFQAELLAIIGLPQGVFENAAKTDILLLRKRPLDEFGREQCRPVFLAAVSRAVTKGDSAELEEAVALFAAGAIGDAAPPSSGAHPTAVAAEFAELSTCSRAFLLAHRAEDWDEHPPASWREQGYWRHVRLGPDEAPPQPGEPVLLYKHPAGSPGAGLCAVMRVADARPADEGGHDVLTAPWASVEPPLSFADLGALPGLRDAWPAYRVHFRGWARGGALPPAAWEALLHALSARLGPPID